MEFPSPETTLTPEMQSMFPLQGTDQKPYDPIRSSLVAGIPPQELGTDRTNPISPGTPHSDWDIFKTKLNESLGNYFGQSYAAVQVVLLTWKQTDLGPIIAKETEDLQAVFRDYYGFQTDHVKLEGRSAQLKLSRVLIQHSCNLDKAEGRRKLLIIYYNGHGAEDSNGDVIWSAQKAWNAGSDYSPALSWSRLQSMLMGISSDILLILDSNYAGATSQGSRSSNMEVLARCAGISEAREPQGKKGSPFTQSLIRHLKSSVNLPDGLSAPALRDLLNTDDEAQSAVYFPLVGLDKQPAVLKPLVSPPPNHDTQDEHPPRARNGAKIILSVTARDGAQQTAESWVSWLVSSCPAAVAAVEMVGVMR